MMILSVVFWIGVNALIGYAIGKSKNNISNCVLLSVLLGPIGWLIALADKGNLRKCPFCAEEIRLDAKVCRYCGRDLPAEFSGDGAMHWRSLWNGFWGYVVVGVLVFGVLVVTGIWLAKNDSKTPQSSFHGIVEAPPISSPQLVTIRQAVSIGGDPVPAGTQLELVSREDPLVYVRYGAGVLGIPISATDLK